MKNMMTVISRKQFFDYDGKKLYSPSKTFDNLISRNIEWLNDPICEQIVQDIDKTRHVKDFIYDSPVLGAIPPQMISGGSKALILVYKGGFTDVAYSSKMFGGNCVEWLRKLSFMVDFKLLMCHPLEWKSMYTIGEYCSGVCTPQPIDAVDEFGNRLLNTSEVYNSYFRTAFPELLPRN